MLQVHTCVSVHCEQCGDSPGAPSFEAHYPSETAALDAAEAQGWLVSPAGRLWCPVCGPILICEAEGHQFTDWHPATAPQRPGSEYRYCQRCCLHESRHNPSDVQGVA